MPRCASISSCASPAPTAIARRRACSPGRSAKAARSPYIADPREAANNADCIVTDTWVSMNTDLKLFRPEAMAPYRVDEKLMACAKRDAIFMHCLPAKRGEEVTAGVIDGPQSVVWDEAENRMHAQKAILAWCLA